MVTYAELKTRWPKGQNVSFPPPTDIAVWSDIARAVYISSRWGPAVPYPAARHHDGTYNSGYRRLKGDLAAISEIPEAQGWPEIEGLLRAANCETSPIESVGCEKGFFPSDNPNCPIYIGSYVDLIFSETFLNDEPDNFLRLTEHLANSMKGCQSWWAGVEFALERLKFVSGAEKPWGLSLRVQDAGRNETEARKFFGHSLKILSESIASLPRSFH
jgi:hypothetical protein